MKRTLVLSLALCSSIATAQNQSPPCNSATNPGPCNVSPPPPLPPACTPDLPNGTVCRWGGIQNVPTRPCRPGLPGGAICVWPSDALLLPLHTPDGDLARQVAIVEGPLFTPVPPTALRLLLSISFTEGWGFCPADPGPIPYVFTGAVMSNGSCNNGNLEASNERDTR